ncbi:MAG: hypothetical protein ACI31W_05545 [Lactococcus sp.]
MDREECLKILSDLRTLEINSIKRNKIKEAKIKRWNHLLESLIAVVSLVLTYLIVTTVDLKAPSLFSDLMNFATIFVLINLILIMASKIPIFAKFYPSKNGKNKENEINQIDVSSLKILNSERMKKAKIPEDYLNIQILNMLIRYFDNSQALTIDEAIAMFDDDRKFSHLNMSEISENGILEREKAYFSKKVSE